MLVFIAAVALVTSAARSDMPLPPPSKVTATSPNGAIRAVSDPNTGTRVEDATNGKVLFVAAGLVSLYACC